MTSRWFPPILALLQIVRHLGLIGYDYWSAARNEKHFDALAFLTRDLARPLFEPYGFCGAWTGHPAGQTSVLGLDFPAYIGAILVHSLINGHVACVDAFSTPRGQIIVAVMVAPLWFLVGLSFSRLAQHRWRRQAEGPLARALLSLGLLPLLLGLLSLLATAVSLFMSDIGQSLRLAGIAFWMFYSAALAAERLRRWPFERTL
ncbi:MAG TPA: hypothetical protein VGK29_09145 [Paludibaculum sp.]